MSDRIRTHLRTNVVGYIALFCFAMSGTAVATHPGGANTISSGDIINGEVATADIATNAVRSDKIANQQVGNVDLADGALTTQKVLNNNLTAADVANTNSLGPLEIGELGAAELATGAVGTDEIADQTVTGDDLAGTGEGNNGFNGDEEIIDGTITGFDIGIDQITGSQIADGSLTAGDTENVFDAGYGSDGSCIDDDEDGEVCASTTFTLNQPGKLLVNATGEWWVATDTGDDGVEMSCVLQVDGSDIGVAQGIGEAGTNHPFPQNGTMALTALSGQLTTGTHTAQTFCTQVNDDIDIGNNQITAARVDL